MARFLLVPEHMIFYFFFFFFSDSNIQRWILYSTLKCAARRKRNPRAAYNAGFEVMGYTGARLGFRYGPSKAGIVSNIFEIVFVLSLKQNIS
jgi:hypothetical protein